MFSSTFLAMFGKALKEHFPVEAEHRDNKLLIIK